MKKHFLIITEGKTEATFYDRLIKWLVDNSETTEKFAFKIINVQGYGNFTKKAKVKAEDYLIKQSEKHLLGQVFIFLALDKDVFVLNRKPPYDIDQVIKEMREYLSKYKPEIQTLFAYKQIEDVFLEDKEGICKYLKIKCPKELKGNSGAEKMNHLFRRANKKYFKGKTDQFVNYLNLKTILSSRKKMFELLLKTLNVKL